MTKKNKIKSIAESIKELTGKVESKKLIPNNPIIQKDENGLNKVDRRHFNKRTPGTGRKPKEVTLLRRGIKALIDQHGNEEIDVKITDPKTGQTRIVKKPRAIIMLETLFNVAYGEKSVAAIKEWLDRQIGKAPQPIRGDGDDDTPVRMEIDIGKILEKAYADEQD